LSVKKNEAGKVAPLPTPEHLPTKKGYNMKTLDVSALDFKPFAVELSPVRLVAIVDYITNHFVGLTSVQKCDEAINQLIGFSAAYGLDTFSQAGRYVESVLCELENRRDAF
jgi:hypothetical protein